MYKLIYKILFTLIIAQLISVSGCVEKEPQNVGIERVINTKIINVPDSEVFGYIGFNFVNSFTDYDNQRVIVQKPRNINGWSIMEPDIINIVYEKESKENLIKNNDDQNIQKNLESETDTAPVPTNYDQYSDLSGQDIDPVPSSDSVYYLDE